jgi:2-oxoisovalerate dehydrogenase E2 component (dihydrolipoyl transacylase)
MARYEFHLPDIGEGIAEAEIVAWHVKVGDRVTEDQPLADLMTDKATVEMESPVAGMITQLAGEAGTSIAIGAVLVVLESAEGQPGESPAAPAPGTAVEIPATQAPVADTAAEARSGVVAAPARDEPPAGLVTLVEPAAADARKPLAAPSVRARARDLGIDLAHVRVAEGARVRHADLDAFVHYQPGEGYRAAAVSRPDETIKIIGMRRRIAENMAASKRHIPHFSYVEEIDVTKLEAARADLNASRGAKPKLTLLPLLIVAICKAIPDYPMLNARFDDEAGIVTRFGAVHLGIATQTEAGLMVPVLRDAHSLNIWQLAAEIVRLADAARSGAIKPGELTGGTLTITSLGPLGGVATTPVINRPEVAIVGPNRIIERPVFEGDTIRRALLMNLSISCDHRVIDGWDAASFVQAIRHRLETPVLLFTE